MMCSHKSQSILLGLAPSHCYLGSRPAHVDVSEEGGPSRKAHAPYMQNSTGLGRGYYFVKLEPAKCSKKIASGSNPNNELEERGQLSACSSSMGSSMPSNSDSPIPGLRLGGILGCQTNIRVHQGLLGTQKVAVKVLASRKSRAFPQIKGLLSHCPACLCLLCYNIRYVC